MENYYMVEVNEDGDVHVREYTQEGIQRVVDIELQDTDTVEPFVSSLSTPYGSVNGVHLWHTKLGARRLLIKGHIVVPHPVSVVTKYEVE